MKTYKGLGVLSGSSMDGLDLCYVHFSGDFSSENIRFQIEKAKTVAYPAYISRKLRDAPNMSGIDLIKLHVEFGHFVGTVVSDFIKTEYLSVHYAASQGHTVFHQPENNLTFQLGDGETTAAHLSCPLVCNFSMKDVALGGQGAPLSSIGERCLFPSADICVNLGGIVNISFRGHNAYHVCPCNTIMDWLASRFNNELSLDRDGEIAGRGKIVPHLLDSLEGLTYYTQPPPKTLDAKTINDEIMPILDNCDVTDAMRTFVEHVVIRVTDACMSGNDLPSVRHKPTQRIVFLTGGGAFNVFLLKLLEERLRTHDIALYPAEKDTVKFKETLLVAFLGLRTLLGLQNVSGSATGSAMDSVSGSIHLPPGHSPLSPRKDKFKFSFNRLDSVSSFGD